MGLVTPLFIIGLLAVVLGGVTVICCLHERVKTLEEQYSALWSLYKQHEGRLRGRDEEPDHGLNAEEKFQEGLKNILFFGGEN